MTNLHTKLHHRIFKSTLQVKYAIFKYVVKISATNFTFKDTEEQVENMIKSGKVENRQMTQGLALFFLSKHLVFFLSVFLYKSQTSVTRFFSFLLVFTDQRTSNPVSYLDNVIAYNLLQVI